MAEFSSTSEIFEKLYRSLNAAQKKAVDAIDGPVMVIAGPGTGKTQILALRIANILRQTDTPADAILALAFTESAVHSMRRRLVSIIGATAYKIPIFTFHGLANDIIDRFPEEFPRIIGSSPAADIDQIDILSEIIENSTPVLRPYGDPLYYLEPIRSVIKQLKRENVGPNDLKKLIATAEKKLESVPESERVHQKGAHKGKTKGEFLEEESRIEKNKALAEIYAGYERALAKRRLYDFEDMIRDVVTTLGENEELLLRLQEQYQFILADEHQDANAAQNAFLELLASFHENPNLFIVGDEKQAIFRFQGASLDNFLYFKKRFPAATVISLEQNYRSSQAILDAAFGLIENNKIADPTLRVKLQAAGKSEEKSPSKKSAKKAQPPITLCQLATPRHELDFLAGELQRQLAENPAADIAVIYRTNGDAGDIVRALQAAGVPYTLQSYRDLFANPAIANLILLARVVARYGDDVLLGRLLYADFLKTDPLDVFKVTRHAAKQKILIADILNSATELERAGVSAPEHFTAIAKKLSTLAAFIKNHEVIEAFDRLLYDSGFLVHTLTTPDAPRTLAALETLLGEVKKIARTAERSKGATLDDLLRFIDSVIEHKIPVEILVPEHSSRTEVAAGVRLMTAHKSKGLEFDTVYIVGAQEGHWGSRRDRTHFHLPLNLSTAGPADPLEDERRLFYVALTRAKRAIVITWAASDQSGKSRLPSQFVTELDPGLVEKVEVETTPIAPTIAQSTSAETIPLASLAYIRELFQDQGWSVTALNNYLACPWQYFFRNLIRLPEAQSKHQLYGIAVHDALAQFFRRYGEERDMTSAELVALFEKLLHRQPLLPADMESSLQKGREALSGWHAWHTHNPSPRSGLVEYSIAGVGLTVDELYIPLRGTLDRLGFLDNKNVGVTDFKTAKPRSRNDILGKTKNADGDYFRQLTFYKLLLDLHENARFTMAYGDIEFIEPDTSGKYHRERFEIDNDDIANLKTIITEASNDIWTGSFWNRTCDDPDCAYCKLRKSFTNLNI